MTGLSWSEETQLKKALYASLNERRGSTRSTDEERRHSLLLPPAPIKVGRKRAGSTDTDNTSASEANGRQVDVCCSLLFLSLLNILSRACIAFFDLL